MGRITHGLGLDRFDVMASGEVLDLVRRYGRPADLEEKWNAAPAMQTLLAEAQRWPQMWFHGYVVRRPRDDYRVTVEGFFVSGLRAAEAASLIAKYQGADELQSGQDEVGTWWVFTWWD